MAERRSALSRTAAPTGDGARVVLAEERPAAIAQIQAWPDTLAAVEAAITQTLEIEEMPAPGCATDYGGGRLLALGAGRLLVSADDEELVARCRAAVSSADAAIIDISHGRTVFSITGVAAAALLSRCVALDVDAAAFPPGRVAETAIHHVDVLIHRQSERRFDIWAPRSFAEALAEWLLDAGAELGLGFGEP